MNAEFGRQQQAVFEADWAKAKRITLAQWRDRPASERFWELLARTLRTQL